MSIKSLLITLPEAVEDIVYQYNHEMKFKYVMDELKEISKDLHHECGICRDNYFSFNSHHCSNECCHHSICERCVNNEMKFEFESYIDNPEDFYKMDKQEKQDFFKHIKETIECSDCTYMVITEDEESVPENWEELDFQDRFGFHGF